MIRLEHLYKSFGKKKVLKGINLDISKAGVYAVLGPNGSGKTTMMKSILGMIIPTSGSIYFEGRDIKGEWDYRNEISYLPQIARFPNNLKVRELFSMFADLRGLDRSPKELVHRFDLVSYLDTKIGHLSGGSVQKINLITAFMTDAPVVILDEPTSGLDPLAMQSLRELIKEEKEAGKIIMITTHIMDFAQAMADEIIFLLEGHIYFSGGMDELMDKYEDDNLERIIARILSHGHTVHQMPINKEVI